MHPHGECLVAGRGDLARQDGSQRGEVILHEGEDCIPAEPKPGIEVMGQDQQRQDFLTSRSGFPNALGSISVRGGVAGVLHGMRSPKDLPLPVVCHWDHAIKHNLGRISNIH